MSVFFTQETIDLLRELRLNNNRNWYLENKDRVVLARKQMEDFANQLIYGVKKFDKNIGSYEGKQTMYKQHRDIRFSADKSPLKPYISSALFYGNTRLGGNLPCYYIHLEEGFCMLAAGVHSPDNTYLKQIRDEIYYNIVEFENIISEKTFKKYFPSIDSDNRLKNAPKGYPKDWKHIDYLKNKEICPSHFCSIEKIKEDDFLDYVLKAFKSAYQLNEFLFRAKH